MPGLRRGVTALGWQLWTLLTPWVRSLRAKFILVLVLLQVAVMGLVTAVVEYQQRTVILEESRKRAVALATHLAALSEGYLLSYNFVKLEQVVAKLAAEDDVAYAIIHTHDGRVATYSGHDDKQGQRLDDPVSQQALLADQPLVQAVTSAALQGRGYDVAVPVFAPGGTRKWGTVRLGFSLAHAVSTMRATSQKLALLSLQAVLLGIAGAIFLALRLARPIRQLVSGVNAVAHGQYDYAITVTSRDDIGYLAARFEDMRQALRLHMTQLADEKQRLEEANTALTQMQEQLIQREKLVAVGRLAAKVAHEVNNPLAIIKTSLRLLQRQMSGILSTPKDSLGIIEEEIDRIARTIRQLVEFARPATQISVLEVNEVIRKFMVLLDSDLAARGIDCRLDLAADLPSLRMATDHLKQLLLNLIKNAQEAMPGGGRLQIETRPHPAGLCLSVQDEGVGIPPEHLASLFEPFVSTKHEEGMGLGLSICYSIIKSYGGAIEVDSQPGQGSTFRVFLPTVASHTSINTEPVPLTTHHQPLPWRERGHL